MLLLRRSTQTSNSQVRTPELRRAALILAVPSSHRVQELLGVIADPVLEDNLDIFDVDNSPGRITFDDDKVGILARRDRANFILLSHVGRTIQCRDLDCLNRSESGLDQKFDTPLVAEARQHIANSGWVGAGEQ